MLILSRKNRESVVIGGVDGSHRLLKVTVIDITGGRVRLGFEVDVDVPVHRAEVWERLMAEGSEDPVRHAEGAAVHVEDAAARLGNGTLRSPFA